MAWWQITFLSQNVGISGVYQTGVRSVFEIELIKQVEINVDYILMLVQKYREQRGDGDDKEIRAEISRAVDASPSLRNKKDLVEAFVDSVSASGEIDEEWRAFIAGRKESELSHLIEEENLQAEEARVFVEHSFRDGAIQGSGTAIARVLPPTPRFGPTGEHGEKKKRVLKKLKVYFDRFFGLSSASSVTSDIGSPTPIDIFESPVDVGVDYERASQEADR